MPGCLGAWLARRWDAPCGIHSFKQLAQVAGGKSDGLACNQLNFEVLLLLPSPSLGRAEGTLSFAPRSYQMAQRVKYGELGDVAVDRV